MKLLALDTSTEACSVALLYQDNIIALDEVCPQQHSKRVLPMIDNVLAEAGLSLTDLDGIVFGRGPGSFTGVRIGVSVAQGLAFGADLPVFGVSTLAAMAQAAVRLHQASQIVAAIDARMAEVYLGCFGCDATGIVQPLTTEQAVKPQSLSSLGLSGKVMAVGTGWQTYVDELQRAQPAQIISNILYPSAQDMLRLAQQPFIDGHFVSAAQAEPVYVRDEVSWKKLSGR
ncbi:tRNA (adenosine(37)-N6)-threonylcarbamoyltransferase complex dimerization subunit type 1 TsaB [Arsukibacterium indicum]|uniref:tRNA threonylcarbamoyladenosine biosynthesis protein TsaB n=1 Tax=Arsukibacterium indicum TaxID=2848612 RepID=A0ABS6MIZ7_9GAMM|nr:tRNA (adenosine(37)-N6)-threonylcarbamoyltransferase complex dimerization subunit type 1 TsaB [Arsukibacterium indicum]MBV2128787.1 tRNA (adenosine(37)-N6)-threonylcarbamoyltransferase complex dimerization subunit type 1 TsaB [Arsukibacterium indicum]